MSRVFTVTFWHNETDDRWVYKCIDFPQTTYPFHENGVDEFGHENKGPWVENSDGFLESICSQAFEEIADAYQIGDSFTYD